MKQMGPERGHQSNHPTPLLTLPFWIWTLRHTMQNPFFLIPQQEHLSFQLTFAQTHKVGNKGINANFVFPFFCSFLHYLDPKMLANVKLDVSCLKGLSLKAADFICLFNFEWHSQNKVGNTGIRLLWKILTCLLTWKDKVYFRGFWSSIRIEPISVKLTSKDINASFNRQFRNQTFPADRCAPCWCTDLEQFLSFILTYLLTFELWTYRVSTSKFTF